MGLAIRVDKASNSKRVCKGGRLCRMIVVHASGSVLLSKPWCAGQYCRWLLGVCMNISQYVGVESQAVHDSPGVI